MIIPISFAFEISRFVRLRRFRLGLVTSWTNIVPWTLNYRLLYIVCSLQFFAKTTKKKKNSFIRCYKSLTVVTYAIVHKYLDTWCNSVDIFVIFLQVSVVERFSTVNSLPLATTGIKCSAKFKLILGIALHKLKLRNYTCIAQVPCLSVTNSWHFIKFIETFAMWRETRIIYFNRFETATLISHT